MSFDPQDIELEMQTARRSKLTVRTPPNDVQPFQSALLAEDGPSTSSATIPAAQVSPAHSPATVETCVPKAPTPAEADSSLLAALLKEVRTLSARVENNHNKLQECLEASNQRTNAELAKIRAEFRISESRWEETLSSHQRSLEDLRAKLALTDSTVTKMQEDFDAHRALVQEQIKAVARRKSASDFSVDQRSEQDGRSTRTRRQAPS